jgi:hypothetical protein
MFRFKPALACLLLPQLLTVGVQAASSDASKGNMLQRAEKREAKRWTLQDWLEQRDRNRMMDLWLSLNSPSPYEFVIGGSHNGYSFEPANGLQPAQHTSYQGGFSAYAQIVGLSFEYENNAEEKYHDLNGLLNLRLFGDSIQSSYLAVHFGQRTRTFSEPSMRIAQQFAQVSLQLYAIKVFGIESLYRIYYPAEAKSATATSETSGNLIEAGAFIDFKNFRLFGDWYKEQIKDKAADNTESSSSRTGVKTGIKIFF